MVYNDSDVAPVQVKILIAGGFGAGKTTFVGAVSEIDPLDTEEVITTASAGVDDLGGRTGKSTTTVAFDFGRITFPQHDIVLYLFGTPGQERFWFMWDELSAGALGAIVVADAGRLADGFSVIDFFESRGIKFLVAVNEFDGGYRYTPEEVRLALGLDERIPVVCCDARETQAAIGVLRSLVQYLLLSAPPSPAVP